MIGFGRRISYSFRCFFSILSDGRIPADITQELAASASQFPGREAPASVASTLDAGTQVDSPDRAVQVLSLLQRDGRLIDFLTEDVSPYPDAQLGAAVRSIHESCRIALQRYLELEPIIGSEEDGPVTVQAGFDPALIRIIGNISGRPPFRGVLRHKGWRVTQVNLPALPLGKGRSVVSPAEVEVQQG